jgi:hypothetical protein
MFLAAMVGGLSCSVAESGTIDLIYGLDDPFVEADAAAAASIEISAVTVEGADGGSSEDAAVTLAEAPYQGGGTLSLPGLDINDIDILQATVFDSADAAIISGRSIPVELGGIQNTTLEIFVQRTEQFSRLPSSFSSAPPSPLALSFADQYVLVANGSGKPDATSAVVYDMGAWAPIEGTTTLPCAPLSMTSIGGTLILLFCEATAACPGSGIVACVFDASGIVKTQTQSSANLPSNCGLADVSGGSMVAAPDGESFIVGGTRPSGATKCVLKIGQFETAADGGFTSAPLTMGTFDAPRQGAAAAWSSTHGLMIAGGNESSKDPPVEYLGLGTAEDGGLAPSSPLPGYAIGDLAQGSGAAVHDADHTLVLAGGTLPDKSIAGLRVFNLNCSGDCAPDGGVDAGDEAGGDAGAGAGAEVSLGSAQGFAVGPSSALFIGPSGVGKSGVTAAFLVSTSGTRVTSVTAAPLRVSNRKGTTAIWSPVGSIVVAGGATTLESFVP